MIGYRIVVDAHGSSTGLANEREWPATVALLPYGSKLEDAQGELMRLADTIDATDGLPVGWDVAWPIPAAVLTRHRNSVRIRCDAFERETDTGTTQGIGWMTIRQFVEEEEPNDRE